MTNSNITVIAVGGSLIVPRLSDTDGIDVLFLRAFRKLLLVEIKKGRKFVLVAGGGKTARVYQSAARKAIHVTPDELDRIGVVSTKLNAALLTAFFGNEAHPEIINDSMAQQDLAKARKSSKKVFIASGGVPGRSTDYVSIKLAEVFGTKNVIIAGDTPFVFAKDPRKFPKAKPLPELTWIQYEKLVPKKWTPGLSSPVDPIATQLAKKLKLEVRLIRGTDMKNFQNAIEGKKFIGTVIR
ncbi:MAG TPA: UMP kinase [Candidatus Paceibacterota bacterium]